MALLRCQNATRNHGPRLSLSPQCCTFAAVHALVVSSRRRLLLYPVRTVFTSCIFAAILRIISICPTHTGANFADKTATGPSVFVLLHEGRMQVSSTLSATSRKLAYLRAWLSIPYGLARSRMNGFPLLASFAYYTNSSNGCSSCHQINHFAVFVIARSRLRLSSVFAVTSRSCYLPVHLQTFHFCTYVSYSFFI